MKNITKIKIINQLIKALKEQVAHDKIRKYVQTLVPLLDLTELKQRIYHFRGCDNRELMHEFSQIRQLCWNAYGCSNSNNELDIDDYDTDPETCYWQLIIWDTQRECILGGCRYIVTRELINKLGKLPPAPKIRTCQMFHLGEEFQRAYLPHMMEIQRLFVIPQQEYAISSFSSKHATNIIDGIFKGLGIIIRRYDVAYLTGRVLFSPLMVSERESYQIMDFLHTNFAAYHLMYPKKPYQVGLSTYLSHKYATDLPPPKRVADVERKTINDLPTLLKIYLTIAETFYFLGAVGEPEFNSLEIAIMLVLADFKPKNAARYINPPPTQPPH